MSLLCVFFSLDICFSSGLAVQGYDILSLLSPSCLPYIRTDVIVAHFNNLDAPPPTFATSYIW